MKRSFSVYNGDCWLEYRHHFGLTGHHVYLTEDAQKLFTSHTVKETHTLLFCSLEYHWNANAQT